MTKQATENCPSESQTSRASERIGRVGQKFGHSQIPTASFVPCQEITPRELRMTFLQIADHEQQRYEGVGEPLTSHSCSLSRVSAKDMFNYEMNIYALTSTHGYAGDDSDGSCE